MSWESQITRKSNSLLYKAAWRKAQKVRDRVERLVSGFFKELVTVGIDVLQPPDLGDYTPDWEPLSDSWIERKGGEEFYFATGALEATLRGKNTTSVFGRPQVFLDWNGGSRKVTAGAIAEYKETQKLTGLKIRVIPFPRATEFNAEALVGGGDDTKTFYKLVNPGGHKFRPLITPFLTWYIRVKIRRAMKGLTA